MRDGERKKPRSLAMPQPTGGRAVAPFKFPNGSRAGFDREPNARSCARRVSGWNRDEIAELIESGAR
jgi:hypothetical protein